MTLFVFVSMLMGAGLVYVFFSTQHQSEIDGYYERSDAMIEAEYAGEDAMMYFTVIALFIAPVLLFGGLGAYALWPAATQKLSLRIVERVLGG